MARSIAIISASRTTRTLLGCFSASAAPAASTAPAESVAGRDPDAVFFAGLIGLIGLRGLRTLPDPLGADAVDAGADAAPGTASAGSASSAAPAAPAVLVFATSPTPLGTALPLTCRPAS
ncbi:hypothetical protein [Streptomyces ortus]|uniref:Secreted protein n=1 Tax=Streptomyces ortus TaxID=2867268 RepID=A0ABT3V836_9ACTN|nr:hypothetical protein [Streptomyces ortus]MCX4235901.1 hypothetical protein [Streptomyces ortus]